MVRSVASSFRRQSHSGVRPLADSYFCYALSMIFCINGTFVSAKKATLSVLDNGFLYADGFYDTLRVYDGVLFELPLHLRRIAASAEVMDISLSWGLRNIGKWLSEILRRNSLSDARVRITVTRGVQGRDFSRARKPTIVITCEKLHLTKGPSKGVSACTMLLERPLPSIKTLGLQHLVLAAHEAKRREVSEVIGVDALGFVREGVTSNVFVVRNGRLLTPKNRILCGLTRSLILKLARKMGIKATIRDFKRSLLPSSDEVFLCNRVREIVPIVRINGKKMGNGRVGPITRRLIASYGEAVRNFIEKN